MGGDAVPRVDREREACREMGEGARFHELAVDRGERPGVDPDLHEPRPDPRALDPCLELRGPARRELRGRLVVGVLRDRDVVGRAVVAGVRHDLQAARLGEAREQLRVAAEVRGRALDERAAATLLDLRQVRQRRPEDRVRVVARAAGRRRSAEVDEHVLVHERRAQRRGVDRAAHRVDRRGSAGCRWGAGWLLQCRLGGLHAEGRGTRDGRPAQGEERAPFHGASGLRPS